MLTWILGVLACVLFAFWQGQVRENKDLRKKLAQEIRDHSATQRRLREREEERAGRARAAALKWAYRE
jgi:hypothetical protein